MRHCSATLLFATLALTAPSAHATTWNILPNGTGDAPTIQAGIDSSASGDTVLVGPGIYTGIGNRGLDYGGREIVVRSSDGASTTIIDAGGVDRGVHFHSGETQNSVLEGLTITNGYVGTYPGGGGVLIQTSNPKILDCVITGNEAHAPMGATGGGGICIDEASALIRGTTITWNIGGGIFSDGWVSIQDCVIAANSTDQSGGGVYVNGTARIDSCVIRGNTSGTFGGGISGGVGEVSISVTQCTVTRNWAGTSGGGLGLGRSYWSWSPGTKLLAAKSPEQNAYIESSIMWGNCASTARTGEAAHGGGIGLITFMGAIVDSSEVPDPFLHDYWFCEFEDPLFCGPVACDSTPSDSGDYTVDLHSLAVESPIILWPVGALGVGCNVATGIAEPAESVVRTPRLEAAPNPFNPATVIKYSLPLAGDVRLSIYDVAGRLVRILVDERVSSGNHTTTWDGRDAAGVEASSGIYFTRLEAGGEVETRKITLVR